MPEISFRQRWDLDPAVLYAVATRCWQFPAGLATTIFIARYFSPAIQGYYYTFITLLSLQSLIDVGLPWVILHFASHEWAHLQLDARGAVTGSDAALERLASVIQVSRRWFGGMSLFFVVVVGSLGAVMFVRQDSPEVWAWPWGCAVGLAGATLLLSPRVAILEGCDQVLRVNRVRLVQAVTASFAVWTAMAWGAGLWAVVVAFSIQVLWELWLVFGLYGAFWSSLRPRASREFAWRQEIWPLQWRLAIQSVVRALAFQLFTPVMFWFHGAAVAGRMGMSWTILTNMQLAAFAPLRTRAPQFGLLIARRDYATLDQRFIRWLLVTSGIFALTVVLLAALIWAFSHSGIGWATGLGSRFLAPSNLLVLGSGLAAIHVAQGLAVYIRAHKRDPLMGIFVTSNTLIGLLVFALGAVYGPLAASWGFTGVAWSVSLPGVAWMWRLERQRRQAVESAPAPRA